MNKLSFQQYRAIDLGLWTVILIVFESVTMLAATRWFPGESYSVSQTVAVLSIVMMRWNGYAAFHAVAGGFAYCVMTGASAEQFAIYCVGNCFALAALLLFKAPGKEKIRTRSHWTILYTVAAFCGAQLGRWIVSLLFGAPADSIILFFATDSLSLLYAVIIVLISRRADGLFEDQREYLIRTEAERRRQE